MAGFDYDMRRRSYLAMAGATLFGTSAVSLVSSGGAPSALVAGSLQSVASDVSGAQVEAHGSVSCRQFVVDGLRDPDALALADPRLFDGLVEPTLFATNSLVLAHAPDVTPPADWRDAVRDDGVTIGRTDPQRDPLGYRTVLALRLAAVDADDALPSMPVYPETSILRTLAGGGLDAVFCYRSMAETHDLPYVDLPASVDFSDPALAEEYASVSVEVDGETLRGAPIRYGAAALSDAGEPWVASLVEGRERLEEAGFTVPASYPRRP